MMIENREFLILSSFISPVQCDLVGISQRCFMW